MRISSSFPSNYLKAADIPEGRFIPFTIEQCVNEDVGNDDKPENKPVLYFHGKQKGLILNRTNADSIAAVYGDETDDWRGKVVQLYASKVKFNGQMVGCIRVQVSRNPAPVQPVTTPPPVQPVNIGAAVRQAAAERPEPEQPFHDSDRQFDESDIPF